MEDASCVHVLQGLQQLVSVGTDGVGCEGEAAAADKLVEIGVEELKNEGEAASSLFKNNVLQGDNVGVGGQTPQSLDFSQRVDLAERGKFAFQAFHSVKGPICGMLHPEDVAKSALACFAFYHVLAHAGLGGEFGNGRGLDEKASHSCACCIALDCGQI